MENALRDAWPFAKSRPTDLSEPRDLVYDWGKAAARTGSFQEAAESLGDLAEVAVSGRGG